MSYLLDTTVFSELMQPQPNAGLLALLHESADADLFTSVLVLGEIQFGLRRLPAGARKRRLTAQFEALRAARFSRIIPVDEAVISVWAQVTADALSGGITIPVIDGLIAATALAHGHIVVTRNIEDFRASGASIRNPWS